MSLAAVVVGVVVASGQADSPRANAMISALVESLGSQIPAPELREAATPSDASAIAIEDDLAAIAVAWLSERSPDETIIRVHVARLDRWMERPFRFATSDLPNERGRALGFALASMLLPEVDFATQRAGKATAPRPPPTGPRPEALQPTAKDTPAANLAAKAAPSNKDDGGQPTTRFSAALSAIAAGGWQGQAAGWGGTGDAEMRVGTSLWLRAGIGARRGAVTGLNGNDTVFLALGGIVWRPAFAAIGPTFQFGLRGDARALYHRFSHRQWDGSFEHQATLFPAVATAAEGTYRLSPRLILVAGLGVEIAFGIADIAVAGRNVATVPALRGIGDVGLRWHF